MLAYTFSFEPISTPITEPVTKFGGQPVWIDGAQWPLSRETGEPMQFIAQIALDPEIFGETPAKMAYLFMTDDEDVDNSWELNGGENALIIQPNGDNPPAGVIVDGPTLYAMEPQSGQHLLQPVPVEFSVRITPKDENERPREEFWNQLGGTPNFLQGEEYPEGEWSLVLQLDSADVPFWINFGDAGVGYAFLSKDGKSGKFLWQCS